MYGTGAKLKYRYNSEACVKWEFNWRAGVPSCIGLLNSALIGGIVIQISPYKWFASTLTGPLQGRQFHAFPRNRGYHPKTSIRWEAAPQETGTRR